MALFQQAVLNKYLKEIEEDVIAEVWGRFTSHFHDPEIQENIRNSKEEEYQDGFLTDLFVKVLGYTKYPASGYNLRVEQKDEKGSKKADGAILKDDKVVGVIELKGTDTTDLDKVESQAFGYKNYHRHADYVIISNFEKLRFYIDNAVEHREFNLFELTKEEFKVLWLCLEQGNVEKGLPKTIKEASLTQNEEVTK
ncbi:MAG: restriction endonuclease subunit M, partial [Balneolaceae bacterium]